MQLNYHNITILFVCSYEYSIIEGNGAGLFSIDSSTGVTSLTASLSLNFDQQRSHSLTILAQNSNTDCQRARICIDIQVLSNRITFEGGNDPVSIPEDTPVNNIVTTIVATGGSGEIQYSITRGNGEGKFAIDSSTGDITVRALLNYEETMSYLLTVEAQSTGSASVSGMATQVIDVLDTNESPYFVTVCANTESGCSFRIAENLPSGSSVGTVTAMDPDLSTVANGMLSYRFEESASIPLFAVDSAGEITTTRSLDREERESYTLTLVVSDGCIPTCSLSIETTVSLTVVDENDNAPLFIQGPALVQIAENSADGFVTAQYIAEDRDSGTNAEISYVLSFSGDSVPFRLNPQTGVLSVDGVIDYEMIQLYRVMISARNPDGTESAVTTEIEVLNLNDNTPIFSQNPYVMLIPEHSTAETISVSATDEDLGDEGDVRYFIVAGNFQNSFSIDSVTGVISIVNDIDRETVTSFNLTVRASDRGALQFRRSTANVEITVTDVNDNSPDFLMDPYSTQVREDVGVPFNILQAMAFDADERGNPNSDIIYSITGGNDEGTFVIDVSTGQIQVVQSLDFETTPSYTLNLLASDRGSPVMTNATTVTINLINVNEDPPMINGDRAVEISELAAVGSVVAVFDALDPDNNVVTFAITSGNAENKFSIGNSSGQITLMNSLDYETIASYMLGIVASDGQQSSSVTLNITVLDENEFAPEFIGESSFSINEEQLDGTLVGTIVARDADGDPANNRVTYSFVQLSSHFTISSSSGEIRTVGVLNRELLTQTFVPPTSEVRLDVTAQDSASPSKLTTMSITIMLVDINDNAPAFAESMYKNSLQENQPSQPIFRVSASDVDLGRNAQITYSFVLNEHSEDTSLFVIDSNTGVISTTDGLDCERQTHYNFSITATDGGTPHQSSSVEGVLYILDENDNTPVFTMGVYERTISENLMTQQSLVKVTAMDADKGFNGEVRYFIESMGTITNVVENVVEDATLFLINETSGVLMHRTSFNYEGSRQVNITVTAYDLGLPRRQSTTTVTFNVLNVDEQRPEFLSRSCDTFIVEEMPPGSLVTLCEAVDPDSVAAPGEVALTYSITSGNEDGFFEIEPTTGVIRNSVQIDSDTRNMYAIEVEATDLVNQAVHRIVNIRIQDINDNAPIFDRESYSFHFTDTKIRNYVQDIVIVRATDRDFGLNGTVRYSLQQDAVTRVSDKEAMITISAFDLGTPSLSANTTLTVTFDTDCLLQEYEIDSVSGSVRAFVLCQIEIGPDSLNVNLGSSNSLFCSILHNSQLTYQWIHNSSLITPPTLISFGRSQVSYTVANARFGDAGDYACKATTRAGSLQTTSRPSWYQRL